MPTFYEDFSNAITLRAHGSSSYRLQAFGEEAAERLEDAEVVQDLTIVPLQCVGRGRSKLRLLGYAEDHADNSLVVLCHAFYEEAGVTLTTTEAQRAFKAGVGFIEQSADGSLARELEISSSEAEHARYFQDLLKREVSDPLNRISRFKFVLITDALMSTRIRSFETDEVCGRPASYAIWDIGRFEDLFLSESGQDEFSVDLTKWLPEGLPCLIGAESASHAKTYLAVLPGRLLADVYAEYGSQLLESNVRTFLSARGKVNKGIQRTLANQHDMFLAYNNGLTTTATSIDLVDSPTGPRLTSLHNWQIVNGGQTTASLAHFLRANPTDALEGVYVAMKLVTVETSTASDMVSSISRYANSQNAVSEADLFSNSPFHVRLEQISRRLLAPAHDGQQFQTKWFYERARGQWDNQRNSGTSSEAKKFELEFPKKQRITKVDWAKYAFSWSQRPHEVSKGAQSNFMAFARVASDLWEKDPDQIGDAYFKTGIAKAILYQDLRAAILASDWYSTGYLANIVTYAISRFAYEITQAFPGRRFDFESIWKRQSLSPVALDALLEVARAMQTMLTSPSRPQSNVTQWAKQLACWEVAKKVAVQLPPELEADLSTAADERGRQAAAKRERQVDSGYEAVTRLLKAPATLWETIEKEGARANLLSPTDQSIIKLLRDGAIPTDRQAARLMKVLQRCADHGMITADSY